MLILYTKNYKMLSKLFFGLCLWVVVVIPTDLFSQIDAHYWTHQYGAKGLLLNGAVIASAEGETSLFYNPGTIGMDDNLGFAFSFLSPSYSNLQTNNFIGDDNVINDNGISFAPGFLGVRFKPFKSDKFIAGIAAFKRFKTDIKYEDRVVDRVNNGPLLLFRGDLDFERRISEDWYGVGLFYRVSPNIGVGISQFSVWHDQELNFNLKKELVPTSIPNQVLLGWRYQLGYGLGISSGFITKLGFSYRHKLFNIGITATSPIYGILRKSGDYFVDDNRTNTTNIDIISETVSNRNRVNLEDFKTASSVGLGFDFNLGKNVLSISMEYFAKVPRYTLLLDDDDSFDQLSTNPEEVPVRLTSENESVFNFATGILHRSSEKLTLLAGFRTDLDQNNSLTFNNTTEYLGTTGDIFHITGGGMFQFGKNQISIGLDIGYGGKDNGRQLADLANINEENLFQITGKDNVNSRFYSAMLFITYDFIFDTIGGKREDSEGK